MGTHALKKALLIWQDFCVLHEELYQVTCREYQLLLAGPAKSLTSHLERKIAIINSIKEVELARMSLIDDLNCPEGAGMGIKTVRDLLIYLEQVAEGNGGGQRLESYNEQLLNIIEKLRQQNSKNRNFLNKAMYNLRNIREEILGSDPLFIYDSRGRGHKGQFVR